MIAFVLSGGGNRGALEAGAALELIEAGKRPDMLVGTSAGALNAAYLASHGVDAARALSAIWAGEEAKRLFPFNPLTVVSRVAQGKSLFDTTTLVTFLEAHIPELLTFRELTIPCYVVATDLMSGMLYLYGDDGDAPVLDAVLASSAHPLLFEPIPFRDGLLVDGGIVQNAPLGVALDKGADEIYLINAGYGGERVTVAPSLIPVLVRSLDVALYQPLSRSLRDVTERGGVTLHHLMLPAENLMIWDMERGAELVEKGRLYARAALAGTPIPRHAPAPTTPPPGAIPYTPPWLREEVI